MTIRTTIGILAAAALVGLTNTPASAVTAAAADSTSHRDPGAPGCTAEALAADHAAGTVVWRIACTERRWVTVDATAFAGTPDDHVIVDEQQDGRWVDAGQDWVGLLTFETAGVDQIRAQAVTKINPSDSTEPPALVGGTTG